MRILFYRDGVPSGQFREILDVEVAAIKKACSAIHGMFTRGFMSSEGYDPAITFVIVQKRHHTRLFPLNTVDSDRSGNVQPGTVVDRGITHPFEFGIFYALLICRFLPSLSCGNSRHFASNTLPRSL